MAWRRGLSKLCRRWIDRYAAFGSCPWRDSAWALSKAFLVTSFEPSPDWQVSGKMAPRQTFEIDPLVYTERG